MVSEAERRQGWRSLGPPSRSRLMFWSFAFIVGVLLVWLGDALQREAARMEQVAVHTVLNQVRVQLVLQYATARMAGREVRPGLNPMALFEVPPMDYRGEQDGEPPMDGSGFWFFDRRARVLVYQPRFIASVDGIPADEDGRFRFRVIEEYTDQDGDGRRGPNERVRGLALMAGPAP